MEDVIPQDVGLPQGARALCRWRQDSTLLLAYTRGSPAHGSPVGDKSAVKHSALDEIDFRQSRCVPRALGRAAQSAPIQNHFRQH